MTDHPEELIPGSGRHHAARALSRPHKIHVNQGGEYNGETYIWCECLTPPGQEPVQCYGHRGTPELLAGLFEDEGLPALLVFLETHSR